MEGVGEGVEVGVRLGVRLALGLPPGVYCPRMYTSSTRRVLTLHVYVTMAQQKSGLPSTWLLGKVTALLRKLPESVKLGP